MIRTTHVGSLPRPPTLSELLIREEAGEVIDQAALEREAAAAVVEVVRRQVEAGVDIISDGEQPRVGFQTYVPQRLEGFGGESQRKTPTDYAKFPAFAKAMAARFPRRSKVRNAPQAVAEMAYKDLAPAVRECELFDRAASGRIRT